MRFCDLHSGKVSTGASVPLGGTGVGVVVLTEPKRNFKFHLPSKAVTRFTQKGECLEGKLVVKSLQEECPEFAPISRDFAFERTVNCSDTTQKHDRYLKCFDSLRAGYPAHYAFKRQQEPGNKRYIVFVDYRVGKEAVYVVTRSD